VGSFALLHWVIVIIILAGPIMGIVRGVKNSSVLNSIVSVFIPIYGIVYFFAAKRA